MTQVISGVVIGEWISEYPGKILACVLRLLNFYFGSPEIGV